MGWLTVQVFWLAATSTLATAYINGFTATRYFEAYTFTATTITSPCTVSTQTVIADSTTAYFPQTNCPLFKTISYEEGTVEITPTSTPLRGIATYTNAITLGGYGEPYTVYDVAIQLSPNEITIPSTTTTGIAEPTQDSHGVWELNNTTLEFLQPVLFTPPASCKPGTVTTALATLTRSSYSFTSLVSFNNYIIGDIVSQVVAAATSTAIATRTDIGSTITVMQYVLPSDMFPVEVTLPSYYSAMDIDPCVDPRATQTTTAATTSSRSGTKMNVNYQQGLSHAILTAGTVAVLLL